MNRLTCIAVASFIREEIMGERKCLFKTLVGIAKLFFGSSCNNFYSSGDVLKGFVSKLLGQSKLQVM